MSKLDLSKFRKVDHSKTHTIMRSDEGIELHIPHAGLEKKHVKALKHLPIDRKMAKGGEVKEVVIADPQNKKKAIQDSFNGSVGLPGIKKAFGFYQGGNTSNPEGVIDEQPIAPENFQQSPPIPFAAQQAADQMPMNLLIGQDVPPGYQNGVSDVLPDRGSVMQQPTPSVLSPAPGRGPASAPGPLAGYDEQIGAIKAEGEAKAAEGREEVKVADERAQRLDNNQKTFEQAAQKINGHADAVLKAYADGEIDPNHYFNSMGTGSRISTGIGLILGGLGGALTGQENPALKFLNQQIDRDIESQRANLGKQKSLYEFNIQKLGDARQAADMTRVNILDKTAADLLKAGARAKGPVEKARATQAASLVKQQRDQIAQTMAQQQAVLAMANSGKGDPAKLVAALVPKEHQAKAFGEIEAAENTKNMGSSIMKAFDQAVNENTTLKTGAGFLRTPGSVYALHQAMQPTFKDLEGTVRQAAMDNTFKNITPQPGDTKHTIETKREALTNYLQSKSSAPTARAYGINVSTPEAPARKKMNGHEYEKTSGGWKLVK